MKEIWKDIEGYEGKYQISNFGRVKSLNYKRANCQKVLKECVGSKGYLSACLCKNGIAKYYLIHRLVAKSFLDNPKKYPEINHLDGNKQNNKVNNLEWCTRKQNVEHSIKNKLRKSKYGKDNPTSSIIYQIDIKTNEIINVFYGGGDIKRKTNFKNPSSILKCCKHNKNYNTAYGYKWEYAKAGGFDE